MYVCAGLTGRAILALKPMEAEFHLRLQTFQVERFGRILSLDVGDPR